MSRNLICERSAKVILASSLIGRGQRKDYHRRHLILFNLFIPPVRQSWSSCQPWSSFFSMKEMKAQVSTTEIDLHFFGTDALLLT